MGTIETKALFLLFSVLKQFSLSLGVLLTTYCVTQVNHKVSCAKIAAEEKKLCESSSEFSYLSFVWTCFFSLFATSLSLPKTFVHCGATRGCREELCYANAIDGWEGRSIYLVDWYSPDLQGLKLEPRKVCWILQFRDFNVIWHLEGLNLNRVIDK